MEGKITEMDRLINVTTPKEVVAMGLEVVTSSVDVTSTSCEWPDHMRFANKSWAKSVEVEHLKSSIVQKLNPLKTKA